MNATEMKNIDVIVIGAGITGLSTAYAVQKAGRNVLVLEASDRVGGRIITRERGGDRVEVGTQYLLSGYENALALVGELGMTGELVESPETVAQFIDRKGKARLSRGETDMLKLLGVRGSADMAKAVLRYATLGKPFNLYDITVDIPDYDNISAHDAFAGASETFHDYFLKPVLWGRTGTVPQHLNLYHLVKTLRFQVGNLKSYGFRRGNVSFAQKLAEKLPVLLEAEASELLMTGDRVDGVKLADGRQFRAGHVIVCTTADAAARLTPAAFEPAKSFLADFHHSRLALVFFYLDRPFGEAAYSFGHAYGDRFFNMSINHTLGKPHLVPSGKAILSVWSAHPGGGELLGRSDAEIEAQALKDIGIFYPGLSPDWIEHSEVIRHDWGYARYEPGDYKRMIDFKANSDRPGLSYASADYNGISLESGVILGQRVATGAVKSLAELV